MARTRHGHCVRRKISPEYRAWANAKNRCLNPNIPKFHNYGGRGITMCDEWINSFDAFIAHIGPRPDGRSLDRIDNNRGYEPGNVRWATINEQRANQRSKFSQEDYRLWKQQRQSGMTWQAISDLAGAAGPGVIWASVNRRLK